MNSEAWFWFFSSLAQTFAALVALVAIFLISRLELYDTRINNSIETISVLIKPLISEGKQDFVESDDWLLNKARSITNIGATTYTKNLIKKEIKKMESLKVKREIAKRRMWILLENTVLIIMLSIALLPLGSLTIEDSSILSIWIDYKLKWALIFGVAGLCIATLFRVESFLKIILSEKE
ncbi:MAG: hypothetical protein LUQ20_08870 [Candidatus Methanoperedens sp.]|nr:hypothetical protein [Candidatus Methanoperedens sp.]